MRSPAKRGTGKRRTVVADGPRVIPIPGGRVHVAAGPFKIRIGKRTYRFEECGYGYGGPSILGRGDRYVDISEHHPFWAAWELWTKQGRKVDGDGFCVWGSK